MESSPLLGDLSFTKKGFSGLDSLFQEFQKKEFLALPNRKRSDRVNRALLEKIQAERPPCFLLAAVLEYIERVEKLEILHRYTFTSFEVWLNHFSGLSFEENAKIRGKIAGKWIDRSDYQLLFPIGMGKVYPGSHFVTAHKSPDLDTTVASFWGWLDAFAARVGSALHIWNLPDGPPPSQIEIAWLFIDIFGASVFTHLAKTRTALTLTGNDLMTQEGLIQKSLEDSIASVDHGRSERAVILVDPEGYYIGDWRGIDVEGVRQVIILLSSCLRWFENTLHLQLITFFASEPLDKEKIFSYLQPLFEGKLIDAEPSKEFSEKQKKEVSAFIFHILGIPEGLEVNFTNFGKRLESLGNTPFPSLEKVLKSFDALFDLKGNLTEKRPEIFRFLEEIVRELHASILTIRRRLERLDIAMKTKNLVFGHRLNYVTVRSDVEEIRSKMHSYSYLTVAYPDQGKLFPVGIIQAETLREKILGTVSLRDFCNFDEMTIPSYLDVISVIDHHKSNLKTGSAPLAIIADAQSSNSLVASRAFMINDRYGRGQKVEELVDQYFREKSPLHLRLLQRALQREGRDSGEFFIDPQREFIEYLHFLYAILDDTDLLTKVSTFDVDCVVELINRLKSLQLKKEVEVVSLKDLAKDASYAERGAMRILQTEEMYSLYRRVYDFREKEVAKNIELSAKGKPSHFFADTKEQNGCARVGQTKMFSVNIALFQKEVRAIQKNWVKMAQEFYQKKEEIDLHFHMISTIVSAKEVYEGKKGQYQHKDEFWIWIPDSEIAIEHLKRFLNAFRTAPCFKGKALELEILGKATEELALIFEESFLPLEIQRGKGDVDIAILRYPAGTLNSRKAMVSPYLPTLIL